MNQSRRVLLDARVEDSAVIVAPASLGAVRPLTPREHKLWREAFEAGRTEGERAGRERGLAEGLGRAQAEMASAAAALAQAAQALAAERRAALANCQNIVLDLALAVARRILRHEVTHAADAAARVVEAALREVEDATVARVRVNPDDKARIEQSVPREGLPELLADPAIGPGGCIVETDCGSLDATVESQWALVEAALREAAQHEAARDEGAPRDAAQRPGEDGQ